MAHCCCSLAPLPKCTVLASFLSNAHSPKCSMSIGKSWNVIGGGGCHCPVRKNNRDTIQSIVTAHDRCSEDEFKIDDDSIQSSPLNFPAFPECISSTISECVLCPCHNNRIIAPAQEQSQFKANRAGHQSLSIHGQFKIN